MQRHDASGPGCALCAMCIIRLVCVTDAMRLHQHRADVIHAAPYAWSILGAALARGRLSVGTFYTAATGTKCSQCII